MGGAIRGSRAGNSMISSCCFMSGTIRQEFQTDQRKRMSRSALHFELEIRKTTRE
jgi:hypothetical protein